METILTAASVLLGLLFVGFMEWNQRKAGVIAVQQYALAAILIAPTLVRWSAQPPISKDVAIYILVLLTFIGAAYALFLSDKDVSYGQWLFRLSLAWSLVGLFLTSGTSSVISLVFGIPLTLGWGIVMAVVFGAVVAIMIRRYDTRTTKDNNPGN